MILRLRTQQGAMDVRQAPLAGCSSIEAQQIEDVAILEGFSR